MSLKSRRWLSGVIILCVIGVIGIMIALSNQNPDDDTEIDLLTQTPIQQAINVPTASNTQSPEEVQDERSTLVNAQAQEALEQGAAVDEGFEVSISGAFDMTMPPGVAQWADTEGGEGRSQLYFLNVDEDWAITVTLPAGVTTGAYAFGSDSSVTHSPVVIVEPVGLNPSTSPLPFNQNLDGMISISSMTDTEISGSFEFSATQQGSDGEITITVSGTFTRIPKV